MENFAFDIATRMQKINEAKKPLDKLAIVRQDATAAIGIKMSLYDVAETIVALGSGDGDAVDCLRRISLADVLPATQKPLSPRKPPSKPVQADPQTVTAIVAAVADGPVSQSAVRESLAHLDDVQFAAAWNVARASFQKMGGGRATVWGLDEGAEKVLDTSGNRAS